MKLKRGFYQCNAIELAQKLLGCTLVHKTKEGITKGIIVETEGYMGKIDKAAHSFKKGSTRTNIQYGKGGYAYIYLIYGMYNCLNVVANKKDMPECVLIRAIEPTDGIKLMEKRRGTDKRSNLCSGPGKLCVAMDINREHYGIDLCGDELYIEEAKSRDFEILATKRINVDYAEEAADFLWRFIIKDNKYISVKK